MRKVSQQTPRHPEMALKLQIQSFPFLDKTSDDKYGQEMNKQKDIISTFHESLRNHLLAHKTLCMNTC